MNKQDVIKQLEGKLKYLEGFLWEYRTHIYEYRNYIEELSDDYWNQYGFQQDHAGNVRWWYDDENGEPESKEENVDRSIEESFMWNEFFEEYMDNYRRVSHNYE